jgi:hypothetical protein
MEVRPSLIVSFMFGASTSKTFKQFYHMPKCVGVAPRSLDVGDAPASILLCDHTNKYCLRPFHIH